MPYSISAKNKCGVIVQTLLSEKKVFQNRPFCCLYVKLVTIQIWRQSNWFPLSYTSSYPSKKIWFKKTALAKISCFPKRTVPTNAFNWVLRYLSQSAHGKVTFISLLVKCMHKSPKIPCFTMCAKQWDTNFL